MTYKVNLPNISYETIDNETIIIDFESGTYYSLAGSGSFIWEQLAAGASNDDVITALVRLYSANMQDIAPTVRDFVAELEHERLIVPQNHSSVPIIQPSVHRDQMYQDAFERPVLHKYTDMQAMLLLDPIHDVNEQGWPIGKA